MSSPNSLILPPATARLIAGVMSGTSADGVDVAICRLNPSGSPIWGELLHFHSVPYSAEVRGHIHELRRLGACTLAELAGLTRTLTGEHAETVNQALSAIQLAPSELTAIADHGQTVFHAPPLTMQLLDPALLAARTGVPVMSDFRRADCALGGQGAPLVPFVDQILFADAAITRALLNLGGIANVTLLPSRVGNLPTSAPTAFDIGPANCLSDHLCRSSPDATTGYDAGGHLATAGRVHEPTVQAFLQNPYFKRPAPKSTDGPEMVAAFSAAVAQGGKQLSLVDALATAADCVARTVADAVARLEPAPDQLILSGGGVHNLALVRALTALLPDIELLSTDQLGIPSAAKEAIAFAILANATLDNVPNTLPPCTGATRPAVSGSLTPRP